MTGKTLSGKYKIKREVGRGGMGVIYEALHTALNRTVAIKVLHPQFTKNIAFLERFQYEARAMARLDHKNIIRVFDVLEDQGAHFIIMEYFQGRNLRQILNQKKKLPQRAVLSIAYQIAKALSYAHDKGVIHRDIKPANIILSKSGIAKIADFGIAATTDEVSLTAANHIIGTPEYMSLEQSRGEALDGRSDLYSLGMVMYEILTGKTYHAGIAGAEVLKKLAYDSSEFQLHFENTIVPSLQILVKNLLKRNKVDRIADTSILIQQIKTSKQELKTEKDKTIKTNVATKEKKRNLPKPTQESSLREQDTRTKRQEPPPFFVSKKRTENETFAQATIIAPKQEQTPPPQRQNTANKWPKRIAALAISTLILAGIAFIFFKNDPQTPKPQPEIAQLQDVIKIIQKKLAQTHKKSEPANNRPWAEKNYKKAEHLEKKAKLRLKEAQILIDKHDNDAAKKTLQNADVLFEQAQNGFLSAMKIAHEKRVKEEQLRADREKRAQKKIEIKRAKLKKERKRQEILLRSELIKLSKEKTRTKKERLAVKKAQRTRTALLKNVKTTKKSPPTKIASISPLNTIDSLGAVLSRLTVAYEKKDLRTLQKMTTMSKNRAIFLRQIFKNYKTVTVSVTDLSIEEERAEATISIMELRTYKGKRTQPPTRWKDAKLIIPKHKGQWGKVHW